MKRYFPLLVVALGLMMGSCGVKRSQATYDFASKVLTANYDGTYVIRVHVKARNAAIAYFTDGRRKAVHEVIFDGIEPGSNGISRLEPLCYDKNALAKHEDFFNAFFSDNGDWSKFASLKDKRTATLKWERNGQQMVETITVTVDRAKLKKYLQQAGIIPQESLYQLQ